MLFTFLIDSLEEVSIHPVLCADGVGTQDEVQAEGGVTQTTKQLLITGVFDLRAFLKPYNGNTVNGLQLCGLVHALEDDPGSIGELDHHGRGGVLNLLLASAAEIKILKDLNQQVKAGFSDGIKYLTNNQNLALLLKALQYQFQCDMIGFGGAI